MELTAEETKNLGLLIVFLLTAWPVLGSIIAHRLSTRWYESKSVFKEGEQDYVLFSLIALIVIGVATLGWILIKF